MTRNAIKSHSRNFAMTLIVGLIATCQLASSQEFMVTVEGTIVETTAGVDPFNLNGAGFLLEFIYDTNAQQQSSVANGGCTFADSTFPFVEATYSFFDRPNGAPDTTTDFGSNMPMRNAYDCSSLTDKFGFPQGSFDFSSEYSGMIAGNGAGLDFGTNLFFPGEDPVEMLPALQTDDIDDIHFGPYVFFSSEHGVIYNYDQAELISIVPTDFIIGDVNCDGVVDLLDVVPFIDSLKSPDYTPKADINQDGSVNLLDVMPFVDLLAGG